MLSTEYDSMLPTHKQKVRHVVEAARTGNMHRLETCIHVYKRALTGCRERDWAQSALILQRFALDCMFDAMPETDDDGGAWH